MIKITSNVVFTGVAYCPCAPITSNTENIKAIIKFFMVLVLPSLPLAGI
jgi:hypothetical protein